MQDRTNPRPCAPAPHPCAPASRFRPATDPPRVDSGAAGKPVVSAGSRLAVSAAFAALAALSLAAIGCGTDATSSSGRRGPAPPPPPVAIGANDALAVIDGAEVTLADLDELLGPQLGKMDIDYQRERHQLIENATRRHVRDRLLAAEAEERGITTEALIAEVVGDKATASEEEVRSFYLQNQAQLGGRTFESIAPQIRDYLQGQVRETLLEDYAEELAAERDVEYVLGAFRVELDLAGAPATGPDDAPITLVEFSDFECPYCKSFAPTLDQVKASYPDQVRIVFLQFPLREIHPNAQKAAEASLCIHEQDKFWEAHDLFFAEQGALTVADLQQKAESLGLDMTAFNACFESGKYVDSIEADLRKGFEAGVNGTPAVFINGRPLPGGAVPFQMVAEIIDEELELARR